MQISGVEKFSKEELRRLALSRGVHRSDLDLIENSLEWANDVLRNKIRDGAYSYKEITAIIGYYRYIYNGRGDDKLIERLNKIASGFYDHKGNSDKFAG